MNMTPIANMLTQIKNAQAVKKATASIPYSNFKYKLAKILEEEGFVGEVKKKGGMKRRIVIRLRYEDKSPRIHGIKMISKAGRKIYFKMKDLYLPKSGYGILIISSPKGLLTSKEARKMKIGGEAICEIW